MRSACSPVDLDDDKSPTPVCLYRLPHLVHILDLGLHARGNHVALQLSVGRQHAVFDREWLWSQTKRPHLFIVRKLEIDCIERRLHIFAAYTSSHDRRKISAPISYDDYLLRAGQMARDFLFDSFRRDLVARTENDQILDASNDPPVPCSIHLALVASVKPSVAQYVRRLLRTVPVARKNVRPAHNDLVVVANPH